VHFITQRNGKRRVVEALNVRARAAEPENSPQSEPRLHNVLLHTLNMELVINLTCEAGSDQRLFVLVMLETN